MARSSQKRFARRGMGSYWMCSRRWWGKAWGVMGLGCSHQTSTTLIHVCRFCGLDRDARTYRRYMVATSVGHMIYVILQQPFTQVTPMYLGCWEQPCERWEKTIQISHHQSSGCSTHVLRVWRLMHQGATCSNPSTSEVLTPLESGRPSEIAMETLRSSTPWSPPPSCRIHSAQQQVMSGWPWDICHESRWMDRHSSP